MNKKCRCGKEKASKTRLADKGGRWKKPAIEEVSKKVMAQPYIRFT